MKVQKKEDEATVRIYSVHANPVENHYLVSAGSDKFVRLYDLRNVSSTNTQPVRKFCPSQLQVRIDLDTYNGYR